MTAVPTLERSGLGEAGTVATPATRQPPPLWIVTASAAAIAITTAAWGLADRSLWLDEATSIGATNQLLETLRGTAANMGLYYVILDGWTAMVGTSAAAVRTLSLIFAVLTVVAFRPVAAHLLTRRHATAAVLALALAPGLTRYAQEARSYTLVILLTTLAWACTIRAVEAHHAHGAGAARRWWACVSALAPLGVLAHGLFTLQLLALAASVLILPTRRMLMRALAPALVGAGTVLAVLSSLGARSIADWVPPLAWSQGGDLIEHLVAPSMMAAVPLLLLIGLGAFTALRGPSVDPLAQWHRSIPVAWGLVPSFLLIVMSVARPYLIPRYVVASVPGLVLLAGAGVAAAVRILSGAGVGRRLAVSLVTAVVITALASGQVAVHQRSSYDWRGAAEHVATGLQAGDALMIPHSAIRMPFEAAWIEHTRPHAPLMVWTPRPLEEVHRFDTTTTAEHTSRDLEGVDRIWIIHQYTFGAGHSPLTSTLEGEPFRSKFRVVERAHYTGGIQVLRLVRR